MHIDYMEFRFISDSGFYKVEFSKYGMQWEYTIVNSAGSKKRNPVPPTLLKYTGPGLEELAPDQFTAKELALEYHNRLLKSK